MENDWATYLGRNKITGSYINCLKSENGKKRVIFVTKTCTKYFTMFVNDYHKWWTYVLRL